MPPDGSVRVRFEEGEYVTQRGTTTTTYRVQLNRVWIEVSRLADASVRRLSAAPGSVWSRVVEVCLPVGTQVERRVQAPLRQRERASTLDLLMGRANTQKSSQRRERLVVAARGNLQLDPRRQ